jgi:DNA polymerase III delta subunit
VPAITVAALQKHIDTKRLAPIYALVGGDVKLSQRLVDAIEATVDEGDRAFAIDRIYALDAGGSPVDIVASARGLPMLGDRRIVVVLRAERLLKPKRAGKAQAEEAEDEAADPNAEVTSADTGALEAYMAEPSASSTLVLVATEVDKSRRLTKRVYEHAQIVDCGGPILSGPAGRREARAAASQWLREELTQSGKAIDPAALSLLIDRAGPDINRLRGDVERLLLYSEGRRKITAEDVDEVASTQVTVDDEWAVVNAIGDGDAARALRAASERLERGDSPHALLGQIRWWVSNRLAAADPPRAKPAIDAVLRTDLALKSSGDERLVLERLVVELTGRPLSR